MKKCLKKTGLVLSSALGISLIGQFAYAQTPISYDFRLPTTGYVTTSSIVKDNVDNNADNYVSYVGWAGSGVNWWICDSSGNQITETGWFSYPDKYQVNYKGSGSYYKGSRVYAKIKTDSGTWHECDVRGKIYP